MKRLLKEKEDEDSYLEFIERGDLIAYQDRINHFILPCDNETLLKHLHLACVFLDDIYMRLYELECRRQKPLATFLMNEAEEETEEDQETILQTLRLDQVCDVFFRWHCDVIQRGETLTGLYAINYFLSWCSFTRAFHLMIYHDRAKLEGYAFATATNHPYCLMVSHYENVKVSDAPMIEYSMNELWNSVRIILPSLYTYSYCRPMRHYLYLLFFRYGDLLASQQDTLSLDALFDNPLFVHYQALEEEDLNFEEFESYKRVSIPVNENYSINNEFLFQGESLFYYQLRRLRLSDDLLRFQERQPLEKSITIAYPTAQKRLEWLTIMTDHWCAMCVSISLDTYLRKTLIEQYSAKRVEMYLYHGERERFRRQFPNSTCEARDILQEIRPLVMAQINSTQHLVLRDLLISFKNEYLTNLKEQYASMMHEKEALEKGVTHWRTLNFEQEALLLTKQATTLFLDFQAIPDVKGMEENFILEELVSLEAIEELIFIKRKKKTMKWPIFLKLMRLYYIIDKVNNRIFKTLFFVEAYFVWLALAQRQNLLSEKLAIHSELLAPFKKLNTLLQF